MKYDKMKHDNTALSVIECYATTAHKGQLRKYTNDPYILHPIAVAHMVANLDNGFEMVAAALLHDVLEDTDVTGMELEGFLSSLHGVTQPQAFKIYSMAVELTDFFTKENYSHLNRKQRKYLEAKRLSGISEEAKVIKRCDIAHNNISIQEFDPGFHKVFLEEVSVALYAMSQSVDN